MKHVGMAIFVYCALLISTFASTAHADDNAVFDRVLSSKTLRCGYTVNPLLLEKDPNTGAFSGIFHDFTQEIAKQLGFKVEWVYEVGSDMIFEGLRSGRYDAVCSGYGLTPTRTLGGDFTRPMVYLGISAYIRADDTRFKTLDDLNKPELTVITTDGEFSQITAKKSFASAKELSLQGLTSCAERMETVITRKGDFTISEPLCAISYMKKNPRKIKQLGEPISVIGGAIIIPHREQALKNMIDVTIESLLNDGTLEQIISKYSTEKGAIIPPTKPYKTQ